MNKEIKRRTDVVGEHRNVVTLLRLFGSVLIEQHDEWVAAERSYLPEASMLELAARNNPIEVIDDAVILRNSLPPQLAPLTRPVLRNSTQRDVTVDRGCRYRGGALSASPQLQDPILVW